MSDSPKSQNTDLTKIEDSTTLPVPEKSDDGDSGITSIQSIDSTRAISDVQDEDLDLNNDRQLPTEQDLKPDLQKYMVACQQGNVHVARDLIESEKVAINDTFTDGITGLHWASINNRLDLVKYLVETGAEVNAFGGEINATPLHWACRSGLVYMADYLISQGGDPSLKDSQSYNGLHLSVHSSNIMLVIYMLYKFCGTDSKSSQKIYVDEPDDCNRTSLHWACYQGDILSVQALLKFGADVTKADSTLFTPLHWSFMRAHKPLLRVLLDNGADIFVKNESNRDSFEISRDMDCYKLWTQVLNESNRFEKNGWVPTEPILGAKISKIITFFLPYIILPVIFYTNDFYTGYVIPKVFVTVVCLAPIAYIVSNFVIGNYIPDKSLVKSPLLSGIFSGSLFWVAVVAVIEVFPKTVFKSLISFVLNFVFLALLVCIAYCFLKAMTLNPGMVPVPTDTQKITDQIDHLVSDGKFTSETFCVHSLVRKPLRSKYSHYRKRLIARFDHYCPWVYNDVGVRNHKVFMAFTYSLNLGAFVFSALVLGYFKHYTNKNTTRDYDTDSDDEGDGSCSFLSGSLCKGLENHHFMFNLLIWTWAQTIWVTLLSVTQTFQILKGLTSYEFSKIMEPVRHGQGNPCFKLLGLDQFLSTAKISLLSLLRRDTTHLQINEFEIPTDYGMKQNWLDFWVLGEPTWRNAFLLPLEGENNLNGKTVNYYTLYEYPAKRATTMV